MGQSFENMTDEDRTGIKERFDHAFDFCYQQDMFKHPTRQFSSGSPWRWSA